MERVAALSYALGNACKFHVGNYAIAGLPGASSDLKGAVAVVSDSGHANGSVQLAVCDGSNWVYVFDTSLTAST